MNAAHAATVADDAPCLIVNADDYGYFRCVSRGILEAAREGIVTATGVFANGERLDEQAAWLRECPGVDAGVHLNLSHGTPLSARMRRKCARWNGRFPGKYAMVLAILSRAVGLADVEEEWQAQIERCRGAGLEPVFLNSHEHIHMLPPLFRVACTLAARHGIAHVRVSGAEPPARRSAGALLRNAVMGALAPVARRRAGTAAPAFLGLDASGRLDEAALERLLPRLQRGRVHELMCHPGRLDRDEIRDPRLLAYHDWEGERAALTSPRVRTLLQARGVRLVRYRDLCPVGGRWVAAAGAAA